MRKTAATVTEEASPGRVLRTMLDPLAAIGPGEYWLPRQVFAPTAAERQNPPFWLTGNQRFDPLMVHALAVGGTWAALAAMIRLSVNISERQSERRKRQKALAVSVEAGTPVFSPDPIVGNLAEEKAEMEIGLPKSAENEGKKRWKQEDLSPWLRAVVPLAFLAGGTYLGYKTIDQLLENREVRRTSGELLNLKDQLDRISYERLMRARGMDPGALPEPEEELAKQAADPPVPAVPRQKDQPLFDTLRALIGLAAISTAASSAVLAKRYFDTADPARLEAKQLDEVLRQLEQEERVTTPLEIQPLPPEVRRRLDLHLKGVVPGRRRSRLVPTSIGLADQPLAGLLPAAAPMQQMEAAPVHQIESAPVALPAAGIPRDPRDRTMALI